MASCSDIRAYTRDEKLIREDRLVDTPGIRLADLTGRASAALIASMRDRLAETVDEFNIRSGVSRTQFCVAVEEALANAFYHGNLEMDSSLKQDTSSGFNELVRHRSMQSPWKDRYVRVTELATPFGIWISVGDEGAGYDAVAALSCHSDSGILKESGRGLVMMKAFSDELFFNKSGNEVTLVFYPVRNQKIVRFVDEHAGFQACESLQQSIP